MTERTKDLMIGRNALAMDGASEGVRRATGEAPSIAPPANPEVVATARRRQFSGTEKRRILLAADRCTKPGEVGALLRSEGIYSSLLATWRKQRDRGDATVLEARKRGRKPDALVASQHKVRAMQLEIDRLGRCLAQAHEIIDVQKKLCDLLGLPTAEPAERTR
jgi:transposase